MVDISSLFDQIPVLKDYVFNGKYLSDNSFVLPLLTPDFNDFYLDNNDKILVLGYFNNNLYLSYFDSNNPYVTPKPILAYMIKLYNIGSLKYANNIQFTNDTLKFYNNKDPEFVSIVWTPTVKLNGNDVTISLNILGYSNKLDYYKSLIR